MTNPVGRPDKREGPRFDRDAVDRLLVHGEPVPTDDGNAMTVRYPGIRELAKRYGVTAGVISEYSKHHNCLRRRREAETRTFARADEKTIEVRANTLAVTKTEASKIIDNFLRQFERNLVEEKVRADSPADFNTMVRLKEFIDGGPDSRQEIRGTISLEALQAKHRDAGRVEADITGEMTGLPPAEAIDSVFAESTVRNAQKEPDRASEPRAPDTANVEDGYDEDEALDAGWEDTASAGSGSGVLVAALAATASVQAGEGGTRFPAESAITWGHPLEHADALELEALEADLTELGGASTGGRGDGG